MPFTPSLAPVPAPRSAARVVRSPERDAARFAPAGHLALPLSRGGPVATPALRGAMISAALGQAVA